MKGRLFLIDGTSLCYRAFYAIKSLSTSRGQPTNAIYGVVTSLKKLMEEEKPEFIGVAFDRPEPTFRHQKFEAYKEHRPPMPDALLSQLPWIKEILKAYGMAFFEQPGVEADDILGTLALKAVESGLSVTLVTGDKDTFQLLQPHVKVYRPTRDGHEIIDEKYLWERWHVKSSQVVDVMALMGDETDAIPGVPGIGEKTAVELIQKFESVEGLLKHLDEVGKARAEAILKNQEQLHLSRELATLDTHVPLEFDLDKLKVKEPDRATLRCLFQTFEFRTLLKDLAPEGKATSMKVKILDSPEELKKHLSEIRKVGSVAIAVTMSSPSAMDAELLGMGISWEPGVALALPGVQGLKAVRSLWEDPTLRKVCPSLKETLVLFSRLGCEGLGPQFDPSLASYLLDPARPSHSMEQLMEEFFSESIEDPDPLRSAGMKAGAAFKLIPRLEEEIEGKELSTLLKEVEIPLSQVLAGMEMNGIAVDTKELAQLSKEITRRLDGLTGKIYAQAGREFNLNSPKQLAQILFEELKLPVIRRTKTSLSTDEETLRRLSTLHELPATLLEYRELYKLSSTYVEALPKLIHPETGRIHTSFHQTATATGRLSSSDPNLQNIPIRTELGRQIRRAFVPSQRDSVFLSADYSQIELRILAHLSQDPDLIEAFQDRRDIHRATAAEVFHLPAESVSEEQRSLAKTINFGILYGMTPFGLSKELGVSQEEAEGFIERYFQRYPKVREYLDRSVEDARRLGFSVTLFHRRRYIPELHSKDVTLRQFAERTAINTPIQGSAADLIKVAMVAVDHALKREKLASRMLLQVHDELVFEVPEGELDHVREMVRETMEKPTLSDKPIVLTVPIELKLKTGRHWLEASHV